MITFTSNPPSIFVSTNLEAKVGAKIIKIIGTISGYSGTNNADFILNILSSCNIATIVPILLPGYSYDISEGTNNTISTLAWIVSPSACLTPIAYSITTLSYISLNAGMITVNTQNIADVGVHQISVSATLLPYTSTASTSFNLNVTNKCVVTPTICSD
jgi:hypothetical protein